MSADNSLAANLWTWPDPLLKRDVQGHVIFVNAAFLQLYGGTVNDWQGQIVGGWPPPSPNGAQRFETRAPSASGEEIYDWVEAAAPDGNAMAIARNITALIAAVQPAPAAAPAPQVKSSEAQSKPLAYSQPPASAPEAHIPEPVAVSPSVETPEEAPVSASVQPVQAPQISEPEVPDAPAPAPAPTPQADIVHTPPAPVLKTPIAPAPTPKTAAEPSRMMERRTLPIEDSSAVLGTNWRDQVIAKALGEDMLATRSDGEGEISAPAAEVAEDAPPQDELIGSGLHILLAEDNAINALLTRTLLEAEGAVVETVEDGSLALDAVQADSFDLIFMDMRMPVMDGLESTRKIRALGGKFADIPIIALTANAFEDDRNACFDSGMNDFMTKPVSAEELSEMVRTWSKKLQENQVDAMAG